jgi:glucokinase
MSANAIGVDLGGSHLAAGIVDPSGKILELKETAIDKFASPETTLKAIASTVKALLDKGVGVCGVGLGLPGNHDSVHGITRFSPNFPSWNNVSVTPYLSQALGIPVFMLNDVRVATLGEFHFGAGKHVENMVMMAIGTGIGGGVVVKGELLIGLQESAGEIGHMTIFPNGPLCNCGNHGCLEALASGPAIAARGADALLRGQSAKLKERIKTIDQLTARIIAEVAHDGDEAATRILEEAGEAVGIAIADLAAILNPELFIIGGGVAQAGKPLYAGIESALAKRLKIFPANAVSIVPASLGVRAGLIGAATYAFIKCKA